MTNSSATGSPSHGAVPLGSGLAALREAVDEVWWYDRSDFIGAPCAGLLPSMTFEYRPYREDSYEEMPSGPAPQSYPRRVGATFAPEHGDGAHAWARQRGLRLAAPDLKATDRAADKITAVQLFATAQVPTPEHSIIPPDRHDRTPSAWEALGAGAPLVVQRRANNLVGRGTRLVESADAYDACLRDWSGETLKATRYIHGLALTVSGCAGPDRTVVSGISHQLVGVPDLVDSWGAHCGNQLVGPDHLPPGVYESCQDTCRRVGDVMRAEGFRGAFGIDLVSDGHQAFAIEVNPRFQTVVGLVQAAEVAAGVLPTLGTHLLSFVTDALPEPTPAAAVPRRSVRWSCTHHRTAC
ncbi:ATP-grasp domain-containing protein [Catenulispora yoronensis]